MADPNIANEDFENATNFDMSGWSNYANTNCTIDPNYTTSPYHGSECMRIVKGLCPGEESACYIFRDFGSNAETSWFNFRFKLISLDDGQDAEILVIQDGAWGETLLLKANRSGSTYIFKCAFRNNGDFTWHNCSNPASINLNQWYKLSGHYSVSNNFAQWLIDDVVQNNTTLTGTITSGYQYTLLGLILIGANNQGEAVYDYYRASNEGYPEDEGAFNQENYVRLTWTR